MSISISMVKPIKSISESEVEHLIERRIDKIYVQREEVLSGKATCQAYKAVCDQGNLKPPISLNNNDKVHVYVRTDKQDVPTIALIRNGMLIARHDSMLSSDLATLRKQDFEPFTVVIDVDQAGANRKAIAVS